MRTVKRGIGHFRQQQSGFTLLEVLVAFVVGTLILVVVLSGFSSGLTGLVRVDRLSVAALVAQSKLAEVSVIDPLTPGLYEGVEQAEHQYRWQVEVAPLNWELAGALSSSNATLYRVEVRVYWESAGRQQHFSLLSLRNQMGVGP